MTAADAEPVTWLARRAYTDTRSSADGTSGIASWTANPDLNAPDSRVTPVRLVAHIIKTDPRGCYVLEDHGTLKGAVMTANREGLLAISMLAVAPDSRGEGIGNALVDHVGSLVDDASRSMGVISGNPASMGLLFRWGYDVHPAVRAAGIPDRAKLSSTGKVRLGTSADRDLCLAVDRRMRGASRGNDHDLFASGGQLYVCDDGRAQGYAYARPNGSPMTVAGTHTSVARELLVACLASAPPDTIVRVSNLTGEQRWAFDVVRSLGLDLYLSGPVMVRGMGLPSPYLPHDVLG